MSDEYVPAITMTDRPEPAPAAAPSSAQPAGAQATPRAAFAQPSESAPAAPAAEVTDDPERPPLDTARGPREVSDKVRGMLRQIAKTAVVDDGIADDLVPMGTESAPAATAAASAPAASASAGAGQAAHPLEQPAAGATGAQLPVLRLPEGLQVAPPAAQPQPAVTAAADEQRRALLDQRERELEERARTIEDRALAMPTLERLAEAPAAAITALLKDTFGITDPEELKTLVADVMTEAAELTLGAKAPPDVRGQMDGRRAVRAVKALRATQEAERKRLDAQRLEAEKAAQAEREKAALAAREQQLVEHVGAQLAPHAAAFPFLTNQRVTGGVPAGAIVLEVYKEQERLYRSGAIQQAPDLGVAAKFADDYYRSQAEAAAREAAYFQSLFAPAPAPAPAAQAAPQPSSPGGAPGPAPTTQQRPATRTPAEPEPDASDLTFQPDRQERRRQSLAKLKARYAGGAA